MTAIVRSGVRRPLVIAVALATAMALMLTIAPAADAAKPDQIMGAQVRAVNQVTCDAVIDVTLNRKGSMKNDIRVTVFGPNGFEQTHPARRGGVVRVEDTLGGPGVYSAQVASVNPRTGAVAQTMSLFVTC